MIIIWTNEWNEGISEWMNIEVKMTQNDEMVTMWNTKRGDLNTNKLVEIKPGSL